MEQRGAGNSVIELTGNRCAVIDGCDGIVDYNDERVILRTGRLTVHFSGRNLKLKRLTENSAVVEGFISSLEYTY